MELAQQALQIHQSVFLMISFTCSLRARQATFSLQLHVRNFRFQQIDLNTYWQILSMLSLLAASALTATPVSFGQDAINVLFKQGSSNTVGVLLFINKQDATLKEGFDKWGDQAKQTYYFTYLDSQNQYMQKASQFFGVSTQENSIILLNPNKTKYILRDQINANSFSSFISSFEEGKLKPFLKNQEDETQVEGQSVVKFTGKSFERDLMTSDKEFLLMVYAPWCGHCKHLKPKYERAAKSLKNNPNIVLGKIDFTLNEIQNLNIEGFPTIFWFKKGAKKIQEAKISELQRSYEGILKFLQENSQYEWVEPLEVPENEQNQQAATEL